VSFNFNIILFFRKDQAIHVEFLHASSIIRYLCLRLNLDMLSSSVCSIPISQYSVTRTGNTMTASRVNIKYRNEFMYFFCQMCKLNSLKKHVSNVIFSLMPCQKQRQVARGHCYLYIN